MAITKISPSVVDFDSALVVSPTLTIGDATAEDTKIVFDGNAQDFYIGLDDSADDLIIGKGSTVGTTPAISIDENINSTFAGTITANAGVVVDNITIDGTEIDLSSGDLTLDVAGDISLDADGGKIRFKDGGTEHLRFVMDNAGVVQLYSAVQDADIKIQGNDGGSVIDALVFDMSEAGAATFNTDVTTGGKLTVSDGGNATVAAIRFNAGLGISSPSTDQLNFITADATRMSISSAGTVTFEHPIVLQSGATQGLYIENNAGNAVTPRITNDANDHTIIRPGKSGGAVQWNNFANDAELMRLTDAGAFGVGTTPSGATFHVVSAGTGVKARFSDGSAETLDIGIDLATNNNHAYIDQPNSGMIQFRRGGSPKGQLTAADDWVFGGDSYNGGYTNGYPATNISTSYRYYFFSTGNLDARFNASGANAAYLGVFAGATRLNADANYFVFGNNTNANGGSWSAYIKHITGANAANGKMKHLTCDGSLWHNALEITNTGTDKVLTNSGDVGTISDQRLKKNIEDLTYSLETFKDLKPRTFEWINPSEHEEGTVNGFIAQELPDPYKYGYQIEETNTIDQGETVDNPDYDLVKDTDGEAFAGKLGQSDAMYVSVIQQLIEKVETLEAEVKALKEA
jgi:hypothetical protein